MLLWQLTTHGSDPYPEYKLEEVLPMLQKGDRLLCPSDCPQPLYTLMRQCWEWEPENRPTFTEVLTILTSIAEGIAGKLILLHQFAHVTSMTRGNWPFYWNRVSQKIFQKENEMATSKISGTGISIRWF